MVKETDDTRGMSLRELVLELRGEVKKGNEGLGKRPTRTELYVTVGLGASVVFGIIALL